MWPESRTEYASSLKILILTLKAKPVGPLELRYYCAYPRQCSSRLGQLQIVRWILEIHICDLSVSMRQVCEYKPIVL